jgi:hypothetical protein
METATSEKIQLVKSNPLSSVTLCVKKAGPGLGKLYDFLYRDHAQALEGLGVEIVKLPGGNHASDGIRRIEKALKDQSLRDKENALTEDEAAEKRPSLYQGYQLIYPADNHRSVTAIVDAFEG